MKISNDIEKSIYNTVQFIKDTAGSVVETLINKGELDFQKKPRDSAKKLISTINLAVEEGYMKSSKSLMKTINKLIQSHDEKFQKHDIEPSKQGLRNKRK